jgi:hypothetical protein
MILFPLEFVRERCHEIGARDGHKTGWDIPRCFSKVLTPWMFS